MPQELTPSERLVAVETLVSTLIKQMDSFTQIANAVQEQNNLLIKLSSTQEMCTREIKGLSARLQTVEQRPLAFWDKVLFAFVGAGATAVIGVVAVGIKASLM